MQRAKLPLTVPLSTVPVPCLNDAPNAPNQTLFPAIVLWYRSAPSGALMSAKNYRDKKALPLVEKLKEVVKNLTIKCVQLTTSFDCTILLSSCCNFFCCFSNFSFSDNSFSLSKVDGQQKQISRLTDKVMEQSDTIERLQEKASDLGRLERHLGLAVSFLLCSVSCTHLIVRFLTTSFNFSTSGSAFLSPETCL